MKNLKWQVSKACREANLLAKEFEIKDLENLRYFLWIEVAKSKDGIYMSQRKYILNLLIESKMLSCKPKSTPIDPKHQLGGAIDGLPMDNGKYQRLVGKLIYLSNTWPNITYAIGIVSKFMHAPFEHHMEVIIRILRYLKLTLGIGLLFWKKGLHQCKFGRFTFKPLINIKTTHLWQVI